MPFAPTRLQLARRGQNVAKNKATASLEILAALTSDFGGTHLTFRRHSLEISAALTWVFGAGLWLADPESTYQGPAPKSQVRAAKKSSEGLPWPYFFDLFIKFLGVGAELRWMAYIIRISTTSFIIWTQLVFLVNYPFKVRRPLDIPLKLNQAILGAYITDVSRSNSILLKKKIFERKTFRLERPQRPWF